LYFFLGLSFKSTAKALSFLHIIKISHLVSIWKWLQKYKPKRHLKKKKIKEYSCIQKDETAIKAGSSELIWLWWVIIEPKHKEILAMDISKERNMFICHYWTISLSEVVQKRYGLHSVSSSDGGGTWYPPQVCGFLKLVHHIHSSFEKSIIERTMQT
jgi:putative transposase